MVINKKRWVFKMYFVEIDKVTLEEELKGVYSGDIDNMRMDYPAPPDGCTFKQAIKIFKNMYLKDKLSKHFPYRFINRVESEKDNLYIATLSYYDENGNVQQLATFTPCYVVTCENDFMQIAETQEIYSLSEAISIKDMLNSHLPVDYDEREEHHLYVKYEFKKFIKNSTK